MPRTCATPPDKLMHDLCIRDALIVDGSGAPGVRGDVAVDGSMIVATGRVEDRATREIDAAGRVISPGFIDVHTHSDLLLLDRPDHQPKVRQGITTELTGLDGIGYAPLAAADRQAFLDYFDALNGQPDVDGDWETVDGWLDSFDRKVAVNVAHHLPHGCVRAAVLGWEDRPATPEELVQMRQITDDAMRDGAAALSTGLDYAPCSFSNTDELVAISEVAGRYNAPYVAHMRSELGRRMAIRETLEIGQRANCPIHISHFNSLDNSWWVNQAEADRSIDLGVSLTFDTYAWPAGSTLLHFSFPDWALDGGVPAMLARLENPDARARIEAEMISPDSARHTEFSNLRLASVSSAANRHMEGRFITDVAAERGIGPESLLVDLVIAERGVVAAVIHNSATDADFEMAMRHPAHMCSTDALLTGGAPHPRTYGTYPRFLGRFVRERGALSLEEMIRHMTSAPARRFGLIDRGFIQPGMAADLVLIDMPRVRSNATFDDPTNYPDGIDMVIVNGEVVVDHGRHTGATPGRGLRRGVAAA